MKILLIGNYVPDGQHSMLGFTTLVEQGLKSAGHEVQVVDPPIVFGKIGRYAGRAAKWFAYIDKLVLFPPLLRGTVGKADIVHICDHSNALYIPNKKRIPYVVTCHDLLAVRGSFGEQTDCPASSTGKWLQKWILRGLKRADAIACVSKTTLIDVGRLLPDQRRAEVLPLALRYNLKPLPAESERQELLSALPGLDQNRKFILHVGSSQRRKNRDGVLRIFAKVAARRDLQLVFAGKPLNPEQEELAKQLNIVDRIVHAGEVSNELLAALYGSALAFLFPSRFEGFGWPIVEAQSLGCPVVCSDRGPFPEVAGDGALMRPVEDEQGFANDIVRLAMNLQERSELIQRGFKNAQRYAPQVMITHYLSLYEQVLNVRSEHKQTIAHAIA